MSCITFNVATSFNLNGCIKNQFSKPIVFRNHSSFPKSSTHLSKPLNLSLTNPRFTLFDTRTPVQTFYSVFSMHPYAYKMGSGGRTIFNFDLNEPPTYDNDERDGVFCFQPQKTQPTTNSHASDLSVASTAAQGIMNNHAFSHASTVSGFQPFIRSKSASVSGADAGLMIAGDQGAKAPSKSIKGEGVNAVNLPYRTGFGDAAISIAVLHHLSTENRRRKQRQQSGFADGGDGPDKALGFEDGKVFERSKKKARSVSRRSFRR